MLSSICICIFSLLALQSLAYVHVQPKTFSVSGIPLAAGSQDQWELNLMSPCKINLFLRILGRRPTGYHDLASLFQAVSLADFMKFSKLSSDATADILTCSDSSLSVDKSNLVIKALELMRSKSGIKQYFRVHLDKIVPMQAGLGGGSGNAATAMYAFNALNNFPATLEDLRIWSGDIGSDITFFFTSGTAYCTGRGEIVESLPPLPDNEYTDVHIFKPVQGLSTALVFKTLQLDKCSPRSPTEILKSFTGHGALQGAMNGNLINDLEAPAFTCEKELLELKKSIIAASKDTAGVMMSGSGTSVYALADNRLNIREESFESTLNRFPGLLKFKANFIGRKDGIENWYGT